MLPIDKMAERGERLMRRSMFNVQRSMLGVQKPLMGIRADRKSLFCARLPAVAL
jgi:hypothetical protein